MKTIRSETKSEGEQQQKCYVNTAASQHPSFLKSVMVHLVCGTNEIQLLTNFTLQQV